MRTRTILITAAAALVAGGAFLATLPGAVSGEESAVTEGVIKNISAAVDESNAGTVYFDIEPTEAGSPSSFKVSASAVAIVQLISAARAGKLPIRITHKSDFTVTAVEF